MSTRPLLNKAVPDAYKTTIALSEQAEKAALDAGVEPLAIELVRIRASQINGCGYCLRMHVRDALAKGETTDRIAVLPAWRETGYFSPAERAALAIAEEITHIDTPMAGVDDETAAVTDQQAAALRWVAISINAFNRVAISSHYAVKP
ncbi:carboxymuconolactone decarboxylase family protein [Mycolicibacterium iranicum]|uniref:Alkylhydroperoxidase n=1 Tax=Mycolicibacterium iranicum TaxID=912594 RepID=A0A1X1WD89_MYCIR|nr:carboxymuconolactone decarboxylase family protein [Mycolicibacterium iranicum]MCZ0726678.1 carboxymuconolactone decarboxylase family protein [Mycolicibacterium iranicum]ORV84557.1 alkylhydroperoxidase [Mycolicibacterium iranicum]